MGGGGGGPPVTPAGSGARRQAGAGAGARRRSNTATVPSIDADAAYLARSGGKRGPGGHVACGVRPHSLLFLSSAQILSGVDAWACGGNRTLLADAHCDAVLCGGPHAPSAGK